MLSKIALISILGISAAVPALAAGHSRLSASVPPASFLNYHVSTVRELSQEVTLDPAVRARLANHFHISEAQMTQYVRENLVLTRLKWGGYYRVACVGRSGREYWINSHLPKGTPIFASRVTGHPILKLACGNPMVSSLPPMTKTLADSDAVGPPQFALISSPAEFGSPVMPGLLTEEITPVNLALAGTDVTPAVVQVSPSLETLLPGTMARAGGGSFNILPALLGGLGVAVASSGRSGSTSNAIPAPTPSVPESSTALSLGALLLAGGGALLVLKRKRMSDKTS